MLQFAGFEVREAADGFAALQRIEEARPDLIVLDLFLPALSGYGVLNDLAAQPDMPRIPVVVVTASQDTVAHPSVTSVLRKPVEPERLVVHVRESLRKHSPSSVN